MKRIVMLVTLAVAISVSGTAHADMTAGMTPDQASWYIDKEAHMCVRDGKGSYQYCKCGMLYMSQRLSTRDIDEADEYVYRTGVPTPKVATVSEQASQLCGKRFPNAPRS